MSSVPSLKDDRCPIGDGLRLTEQGHSSKALTAQSDEKTATSDIQPKIEESPKTAPELNQSFGLNYSETSAIKESSIKGGRSDDESDETKSTPSTSNSSIEAVESRQPTPTSAQSPAGRILLKRRRSRISMPTVTETRNAPEEVDSAPPRPTKRRSQKKEMIALFLESDYPRKK